MLVRVEAVEAEMVFEMEAPAAPMIVEPKKGETVATPEEELEDVAVEQHIEVSMM